MDYKIRIVFSKKDNLIFISHLDLMRLFSRALRRTGCPIKFTQGFNPHPKFSIKRALKLGIESDNEEAFFELKEVARLDFFKQSLQNQLPASLAIKEITSYA